MGKNPTDIVFYDGHCGLCHWTVRFLLTEDSQAFFRFAPLQSKLFEKAVAKERRRNLPDSIVLLTRDDKLLNYSSAVVYMLRRLGGVWRILGTLLWLMPRALRDAGYRAVANVRYKLFKKPEATCPLIPPQLQNRFLVDT
jgi:predicted DCC family thiol-disulfide oxidoreductase YuxK